MANQSPDRRAVLTILAKAAAASQFPGFCKWVFAGDHQHGSETIGQLRPTNYQPQFFTKGEYQAIEILTELIIPTDESPGAKEAGVSEFIDFMAAHGDQSLEEPMRTGLRWINRKAAERGSKTFVDLRRDQQELVLEEMAYQGRSAQSEPEGHAFFRLIRRYTVMGYYTSRIGLEELKYPGLQFYPQSPECPHQNDPEHRYLPPPRF